MSTASVPTPALLTAEQFAERPDPGYPEELVRGRIVPMSMPKPRHGEICNKAGRILGNFAEDRDLGRVLSNDTGVITERGPDTVRGADISFYSFARVPKGPLPDRYLDTPPDLVVAVRLPHERSDPNRWRSPAIKSFRSAGKGASILRACPVIGCTNPSACAWSAWRGNGMGNRGRFFRP
jgi:Uma2 family endonuclease